MVNIILGDTAEQEITKLPLSNNTIQRRILYLSNNIGENVISKFKIVALLFKSMNTLTSEIMSETDDGYC